ncbi:MAG: hypothetical protein FWE54_05965 [Methanimicrococcus sp.]|nr:hypothetical protein [Methanimicrococcus sp.]
MHLHFFITAVRFANGGTATFPPPSTTIHHRLPPTRRLPLTTIHHHLPPTVCHPPLSPPPVKIGKRRPSFFLD